MIEAGGAVHPRIKYCFSGCAGVGCVLEGGGSGSDDCKAVDGILLLLFEEEEENVS